jgi:hypothetical protein
MISIQEWKGGEATRHLPESLQFGDLSTGTEVHLRVGPEPFALRLVAKHTEHQEPSGFVDEQVSGPFRSWRHEHRFIQRNDNGSILVDEIEYQAPFFGLLNVFVEPKITKTFHLRHLRTRMDVNRFARFAHMGSKKIAITGASGLIGRNLSAFLRAAGHDVYHLVRREPRGKNEVQWNVQQGFIDTQALEGMNAVVHLAGESIDGRWTQDKKSRIYNSRVKGTTLLSEALTKLNHPPSVFLSASAVGVYGNHPSETATESTSAANDFLGRVCTDWEMAAEPARSAGIRVVHPRMGVVLSGQGGALKKMLPPFLAGTGGKLGTGKQWMPWVALEDALGLLYHLIMDESFTGPVNVVSPNAIQNVDFTTILGKVLKRPTWIPVPAFAIKTMFGEMGQTLLLEGRHVKPEMAMNSDFEFQHADLEAALRFELGRFNH